MNYNQGNLLKYQTKNPLKRFMINYFLRNLVAQVRLQTANAKKCSLLDAGCGEGMVASLLYDEFDNLDISAFDFFPQAIDIAKTDNNRKINFFLGDVENLNLDDDSFDVVLATEVLEHLDNPKKALHELFRVAKSSVIVSVPNEPFFCLGNLISGKNISRFGNPIDHINHWTFWGFKKFLRENLPENAQIKLINNLVWTMAVVTKK